MILNLYTIVMLFTAVVTGVLAVPLGVLSYRLYAGTGKILRDGEKTMAENRSYLFLLTAVVILSAKLLAWPFFYVTLQSYVPSVPGAMCIFGVTRAQPVLGSIVQLFKPVVFFSIGAWLLLNRLDRSTDTSPLFRRKFAFLSAVSLLILCDSVLDIAYFTGFTVKTFVSCCTTFFDLPERATAIVPASLFGERYSSRLIVSYYASNIAFVVFHAFLAHRSTAKRSANAGFLPAAVTGGVISIINAAITVIAMFEIIAPDIMAQPLHHCIYCMWQYNPHSILMTASFVAGTFSPGWALVLYLAGKHEETTRSLGRFLSRIYIAGTVGIVISTSIVSVHLLW